ncbi:MAG: BREX-3 system phosphatase PglZ, partial [Chloroflexota bacterium]|nr:BREX-3 system phosphatase PglZ [Chloroflexota bacterium]
YLARQLRTNAAPKLALIIVDGLALNQWFVLREVVQAHLPTVQWDERALFAWMPTLTPVSRQAILAGRLPQEFAESLQHTNREETLWQHFWQRQYISSSQVFYQRGLGRVDDLAPLAATLKVAPYRVVALIINKVDDIMHGMQLGMAGMLNQVRQWGEQGYLARLIAILLNQGWRLYLTSDHGNIEATGIGLPREGAAAELRGERVRVYRDERLLQQTRAEYPEAVTWPAIGLPADYLSLLAPSRKAFIREGVRTVSHGGLSIEELVVPFVEIKVPA